MSEQGKSLIPVLLLVGIAVFGIYVQKLGNEFVFDDYAFVLGSPEHDNLQNIPGFFITDQHLIYRPIRSVLYTFAYHFFGHDAPPYHLIGLLLHLAVTLVFTTIIFRMTENPLAALICGLLAGLHPVHTDRAVPVTASFDLVGMAFGYGSILPFLRWMKTGAAPALFLSALLFTVGIFGSEEAATVPLLLMLLVMARPDSLWHKRYFTLGYPIILSITLVYLIIRTGILKGVARSSEYAAGGLWQTLWTMPAAFTKYIGLALSPVKLAPARSLTIYDGPSLWPVISLGLLIAAAIAAFACRKKSPMFFIGIGWFFIGLAPFSNLIPLETLFAERYFYAGLLGMVVLMGGFGAWLIGIAAGKRKIIAAVSVLLIIATFALMTSHRIRIWKDNDSLWENAVKNDPRAYLSNLNWGNALKNRGEYKKAVPFYKKALAINPNGYKVHIAIGNYHVDQGNHELAREYFKRATKLKPGHLSAIESLMQSELMLKNYNQAFAMAEQTLVKWPNNLVSLGVKSYILVLGGRCDLAVPILENLIKNAKDDNQRETAQGNLEHCLNAAPPETE